MTYAAQLITATRDALALKTYRDLSKALGVTEQTLSQWRHGVGSPMPEERVLQLCDLARIADPAPWLAGVHADGVRDPEAHRIWESLLDRIRPSVTTAVMLGVALLATFAPPPPARAETPSGGAAVRAMHLTGQLSSANGTFPLDARPNP